MTDHDTTAETTEDAREQAERAAYILGLRQLAAFVEAHPDLPIPFAGSANAYVRDKQHLASFARAAGVRWQKRADQKFFYLRIEFAGGHSYDLNIDRPAVCRKVVTGTRVEPAKPEQIVEEFHWVCDEPLLATGGEL